MLANTFNVGASASPSARTHHHQRSPSTIGGNPLINGDNTPLYRRGNLTNGGHMLIIGGDSLSVGGNTETTGAKHRHH
jgi:hypothetical protein